MTRCAVRPTQVWIGLWIAFSLTTSSAGAQSFGAIVGKAIDAETGGGLPGVSVRLEGTSRGAVTDAGGKFRILRVNSGAYTLVASLIGYASARRIVTVQGGSEVRVDLQLSSQSIPLDEVLVQADRAFSAASSRTVRDFDLRTRPGRSAQQMLQMTPGLVIAQHAGGGKAEQVFLRGFDADHGTDVAISVDGMPVNMVSHGHGQGYADLHFVIPEVVERIDVFKGPYSSEHGNLATAGAVAFRTREHLDENAVGLEGGGFNSFRYKMLYQIPTAGRHQAAYLAGDFYRTDGPFRSPQGFHRFNLFAKIHAHLSEGSTLAVDVGSFSSAWNASGQIPRRAVQKGLIDRWGAIDDAEGGATGRQNVNLTYQSRGGDSSDFMTQMYLSRYHFKLFSNFTFFRDDPINGDMIEQTDARQIVGLNNRFKFFHGLGPVMATTTLGGGFRSDDIEVSLWRSPGRRRLERRVDATIGERNLFLWTQEEMAFGPQLRLQVGLRGDYFTFDVNDHLEGSPTGLPRASGYAQQTILNPKVNLAFNPRENLDFFANFGTGFHSNDARAVVLNQRVKEVEKGLKRQGLMEAQIASELEKQNFDPGHRGSGTLPRAVGGELGLRTRLCDRLNLGAAAWWLDLEREFIYAGDAGTTEESGRTRRFGVDLEGRAQVLPWLWGDVDVNLSKGEARDQPDGANEIPLAPWLTSTGGLTARHPKGYEGSLRYRRVGDRPANEDGSVTAAGYTVFDLAASYRKNRYKIHLVVENLFNAAWNEAQFDTRSLLPGEIEPASEIHFTPGNPFNVRLGLSYFF